MSVSITLKQLFPDWHLYIAIITKWPRSLNMPLGLEMIQLHVQYYGLHSRFQHESEGLPDLIPSHSDVTRWSPSSVYQMHVCGNSITRWTVKATSQIILLNISPDKLVSHGKLLSELMQVKTHFLLTLTSCWPWGQRSQDMWITVF